MAAGRRRLAAMFPDRRFGAPHRHSRTGAIARHGRRPGSRTVMGKARICNRFRRMGFQREGRLCAKPFPLACLSSGSFRMRGKNRPPAGRTGQRIPPGHPGRPAAPAQENETCQKGRGTVLTVPCKIVRPFGRVTSLPSLPRKTPRAAPAGPPDTSMNLTSSRPPFPASGAFCRGSAWTPRRSRGR